MYFEYILHIAMIVCLINVAIVIKHHALVTKSEEQHRREFWKNKH